MYTCWTTHKASNITVCATDHIITIMLGASRSHLIHCHTHSPYAASTKELTTQWGMNERKKTQHSWWPLIEMKPIFVVVAATFRSLALIRQLYVKWKEHTYTQWIVRSSSSICTNWFRKARANNLNFNFWLSACGIIWRKEMECTAQHRNGFLHPVPEWNGWKLYEGVTMAYFSASRALVSCITKLCG